MAKTFTDLRYPEHKLLYQCGSTFPALGINWVDPVTGDPISLAGWDARMLFAVDDRELAPLMLKVSRASGHIVIEPEGEVGRLVVGPISSVDMSALQPGVRPYRIEIFQGEDVYPLMWGDCIAAPRRILVPPGVTVDLDSAGITLAAPDIDVVLV